MKASKARVDDPALPSTDAPTDTAIDAAVFDACARIAPTWPLDRFIAVNPFWQLVDAPLPEVTGKLASLSGARLLAPRALFRQAYQDGTLRDEHLQAAIDAQGSDVSVARLVKLLHEDEPRAAVRRGLVDVADELRDLDREPSWRGFVTHSISQFCAAYFDDSQATFQPSREGGLYASWRRHAVTDRSPALLMHATAYRTQARQLPGSAPELIALALSALGIDGDSRRDYLWSLLLDQNGWASWCAYLRWEAQLAHSDDASITELLAIRLAWDWLLHCMGGEALARRWAGARAAWPRIDAQTAALRADDWLLQTALEIAWREPMLNTLPASFQARRPSNPAVQAVFCIDVRSEVLRRALEAGTSGVQTLGFAGFFGLPIDYQPLAATKARPQLPGLLAPRLRVVEVSPSERALQSRRRSLHLSAAWKSFKTDPFSTFTFVEALGLTYAAQLFAETFKPRDSRPKAEDRKSNAVAAPRPRLATSCAGEPIDLETRCEVALAMLRGMSLTCDFAPVVLLVGHGSATRNNPQAAGLHCGACCGQTGEVNARVAAALLNDPEVRIRLARKGVAIPETTWFLPALHNTTTEDLALLDLDLVPTSRRPALQELSGQLEEASARARLERAPNLGLTDLGLTGVEPAQLARAMRARSQDWAQVRPEWGLAGNAAFIIAPRERTQHLNLQGRAFLHEYRAEQDAEHRVLEQILTAPMLVTHWINFQYYASTVDNLRYGSGNKLLHNVVGAHLGVFEGNGGDLRIGLPLQSLHDGEKWMHTPLRLSVLVEAPRAAIDAILEKHAKVRELAVNGWLNLLQLDEREGAVYWLHAGRWQRQTPRTP